MQRIRSFENEQGPALYLVATPIGNMKEVSKRTLETLEAADVIACEDTRNSGRLLSALGIKKPLIAHHEYNQEASVPGILDLLEQGKKVAVISDAGYPLVSDPGSRLVSAVLEQGIPVVPISGPNAAINALVASGLDTSHYLYYGFLDAKSSKRKAQLEELKDFPYTIIFYEAPHRIDDMLKDVLEVFGDRKMVLARELTKLYEEYIHGTVSEVIEVCPDLKGEMVVLVSGAKKEKPTLETAMEKALKYMEEGRKMKEAAGLAAKETGLSKNEIYSLLLENKKKSEQ